MTGLPQILSLPDRTRALEHDQDLAPLFPLLLDEAGAGRSPIAVLAGGAGRLAAELGARACGRILEAPDPLAVPLGDGGADLVACEHLLAWHPEPAAVVREFRRVLRTGGHAVIAAEPDYHAAIEHPSGAAILGLLAGVLRKRGAETEIGRRLPSLFPASLWSVALRIHPPPGRPGPSGEALDSLVADVRAALEGAIPAAVIGRWEGEARAAAADGSLFLYVPHFALVARRLG